ncbi:hypothetical protein [Aminobacter sp. AP02]|uniref:hypothetical protein n=1 Tax=Aminobacter sp. AP02 TaxID=2135737 RepID=UPI000D6A84E5|nr:hypothetical protein [Aminobacter sp. AP02]PWK72567.1 hypothetical protein C8K44_1057 [Aminobacter sp. AP02]
MNDTSRLAAVFGPLQTWFALLAASNGRSRRRAMFDPRDVSDHLNRDLGYLDGREPHGSVR